MAIYGSAALLNQSTVFRVYFKCYCHIADCVHVQIHGRLLSVLPELSHFQVCRRYRENVDPLQALMRAEQAG